MDFDAWFPASSRKLVPLVSLGIHVGHDSSCAVVVDGEIASACQQERYTRRKHDGHVALNSQLPIDETLSAVGLSISDVDVIVTSYQATCPGGVGLRSPLWTDGFKSFDVFDKRHFVVSHHLAHALSAFGLSAFPTSAALVCDLGGSTTETGKDYYLHFLDFYNLQLRRDRSRQLLTENVSFYSIEQDGCKLIEREFSDSSSVNDVYVSGLASLYDNASRHIFGVEDAHGQFMALASMCRDDSPRFLSVSDVITICDKGEVEFKNGWQASIPRFSNVLDAAGFAKVIQDCFVHAVTAYARKLSRLSAQNRAVLAGGVFLNIPGNSEIRASGVFEDVFIPSAPHDAGIAIGCAFAGQQIWSKPRKYCKMAYVSDRLGKRLDPNSVSDAIFASRPFLHVVECDLPRFVASEIASGKIVARCSGRSEFGPRALGGRSLLASPLLASTKEVLNRIKGRQPWRPVAPLVVEEDVGLYFDGPSPSPFMNFLHRTLDPQLFQAVQHPDGSSRVQTLRKDDDPELYSLVLAFKALTGRPVLVNTSLNGRGQPIVESAHEAMAFFRHHIEVDYLILGDKLVGRTLEPFATVTESSSKIAFRRAENIFCRVDEKNAVVRVVSNGKVTTPISAAVFSILEDLAEIKTFEEICVLTGKLNRTDRVALARLFDYELIKEVGTSSLP